MKKINLVLASCFLGGLSACFSQPAPNNPVTVLDGVKLTQHDVTLLQQAKAEGKTDITVVDAGKGKQEGGSFLFNVKFSGGSFKTKQSSSGHPAKNETNVHAFNVALVQSAGAPTGTITAGPDVAVQNIIPANLSGVGSDERTILFKNVPANATGPTKDYYVVLVALEDIDAGAPILYKNITHITAPLILDVGSPALEVRGKAFVTDTGGIGGNSGKVNVGAAPNYTIAGSATLSFTNFKLLDETGATIDSQVTVGDGGSYVSGVTVQ